MGESNSTFVGQSVGQSVGQPVVTEDGWHRIDGMLCTCYCSEIVECVIEDHVGGIWRGRGETAALARADAVAKLIAERAEAEAEAVAKAERAEREEEDQSGCLCGVWSSEAMQAASDRVRQLVSEWDDPRSERAIPQSDHVRRARVAVCGIRHGIESVLAGGDPDWYLYECLALASLAWRELAAAPAAE